MLTNQILHTIQPSQLIIFNYLNFSFKGNIMTLSYNMGLISGALAAYVLEKFLGQVKSRPCAILTKHEIFLDSRNATTKSAITRMVSTISTTTVAQTVGVLGGAIATQSSTTTWASTLLNSTINSFNSTTISNEI